MWSWLKYLELSQYKNDFRGTYVISSFSGIASKRPYGFRENLSSYRTPMMSSSQHCKEIYRLSSDVLIVNYPHSYPEPQRSGTIQSCDSEDTITITTLLSICFSNASR